MSYELIETVEVGAGGASSIEFTSIPQDGTDLVLKASLRTDRASQEIDQFLVQFNNDTASNYSRIELFGQGTTSGSSSGTSTSLLIQVIPGPLSSANTFSSGEVYLSNYTSSNNKSISVDNVLRDSGTEDFAFLIAGLYSDTTAISSIQITALGDYVEHSTVSLYKVTA